MHSIIHLKLLLLIIVKVDQNILLAKISVRDGEKGSSSTSRRVRHVNDLAKVIMRPTKRGLATDKNKKLYMETMIFLCVT